MRHKKLYLLILVIFIAGLILGHFFIPRKIMVPEAPTVSGNVYPYLARRIFLDDPNDTILNFTNLREYLKRFTEESPNIIGVYFEYLPTGTTIGANDREVFFAASLVKTPIIMEVLKRVESGDISENEELTIEADLIDKEYGELWKKGVGTKITVKEAINLAMIQSDNTAYQLLRNRIKNSPLTVFNYLDIPVETSSQGIGITPKNFSSILRSLYFSAYLNYENSNELLDIMSKPYKDDLISQNIPENIKVANKIGVYQSLEKKEEVYSDCGIVYYPKRNYSLCIMVKGANDQNTARQQVIDISKVIYDYISKINLVNN